MFPHLSSLLFLSFTIVQAFENETSACNHDETSIALLDVAMDVIAKAKLKITMPPSFISKPMDCVEILSSGQTKTGNYTIWPRSRVSEDKPLQVSCDMDTDRGGWTVIQRRGDFGRVSKYFFKGWASYKKGFGDVDEDFWLGNDNIFALTSQRLYSIRFDLKDADGETTYALYDTFWIDDEAHKYTLHIKGYSGNAGDSLSRNNNVKFSTKDKDNDNWEFQSCALQFEGGWWYNSCEVSNLNGPYWTESIDNGITWLGFNRCNQSLAFTEMKIRPRNF